MLPDSELLTRARASRDTDAFDELYRRHRASVFVYAVSLSDPHRAEDLAAEAFARLWRQLLAGKGPTDQVRAYLKTTVRHLLVDEIRATAKHLLTDDTAAFMSTIEALDGDELDTIAIRDAYRSLPVRWQLLLQLTVIEDRTHADLGSALGLRPNAIAAVAKRARDGLRTAYLTLSDDWPEPPATSLCHAWERDRHGVWVDDLARAESRRGSSSVRSG